jgi:hypothetical protein
MYKELCVALGVVGVTGLASIVVAPVPVAVRDAFQARVDYDEPTSAPRAYELSRRNIMSDDTKRSGSPDSRRINIDQEHEVRYWTREMNVSSDELREAVQAAGTSVEAVRNYLKKK